MGSGTVEQLQRPDLATTSVLERQLRARVMSDAVGGQRFLAFVGDLIKVP